MGTHERIDEARAGVERAAEQLLGGGVCSIATGTDAAPGFREALFDEIQALTGWKILDSPDRPPSCRDTSDLLSFSAALRGLASALAGAAQAARAVEPDVHQDLRGAQRMVERAALVVEGNDGVVSLSSVRDEADLDLFTAVLGYLLPSGLELLTGVVRGWAGLYVRVPLAPERWQSPVASSAITASTRSAVTGEAFDQRQKPSLRGTPRGYTAQGPQQAGGDPQ